MNPRAQWNQIKKLNPKTPDAFMNIVHTITPNLTECDVISWQRSSTTKSWERELCDFIWAYIQIQKGHTKFHTFLNTQWPIVKNIIDTQNLESAFEQWSI
jgi:hypothetical protein